MTTQITCDTQAFCPMAGFLAGKLYVDITPPKKLLWATLIGVMGQDNTDMQYKGFRDNIPVLFVILTVHTVFRKLLTSAVGNADIKTRALFDNIFAIVFLVALHGISYFKMLFLIGLNYAVLKIMGANKATPIVTWGVNLFFLFSNEWNRGYSLGRMFGQEYGWIDSALGGIMPRWEVHFNLTMLRIISFNMDYYWALTSGPDLEV